MKFLNKYTWIFPILIIAVAIFYGFSALNTLRLTHNDEIIFNDFYDYFTIKKEIPLYNIENQTNDTLTSEYILLSFDNNNFTSLQALRNHTFSEEVEVDVLHLPSNEQKTYIINNQYLNSDYIVYFTNGIYTSDVLSGGISEKAGIKKGDILILIDDKSVASAYDADEIINSRKTSEELKFLVLRSNLLHEISINRKLTKFHVHDLISLCSGFLMILIGLFIGINRPKIRVARLVSLSLILLGCYIANKMSIDNISFSSVTLQIMGSIGFIIIKYMVFPVIGHSLIYFPIENQLFIKRRWVYKLFYAISIVFLIVEILMLVFGFANIRLLYFLFSSITFIYLFEIILFLLFSTPQKNLPIVKPIYMGYMIFIIGLIFVMSAPIFISSAKTDLFNNLLMILALPIPIAYFFVIGNNHLLDLNLRFNRSILYQIALVILTIVLLAIFLFFAYHFLFLDWQLPHFIITKESIALSDQPIDFEKSQAIEKFLVFASLFVITFILRRIYFWGREKLDIQFKRATIDFRTLTARLRQIPSRQQKSTEDLLENYLNTIATGLLLKRAGIWLYNENKLYLQKYFGLVSNSDLEQFADLSAKEVMDQMSDFKRPIPISYLPNKIKEVLHACEFKYILPLATEEKCIGLLFIGEKLLESKYTSDDLNFFSDISSHSTVVLENALLTQNIVQQQRIQHEIELVSEVYKASMPNNTIDIDGLDIIAYSKPAYEIGGDFYDFYNHAEDQVSIIIGDVSGKGISAALYMSNALGIIQSLSKMHFSPKQILSHMNLSIKERIKIGNFITATTANFNLEKKKINIARAGHTPIYHYSHLENKITQYQPDGLGLGLVDDKTFSHILKCIELPLVSKDIFIFVSDGLTEARNADDEEIGEQIIYSVIQQNKNMNSKELLDTLLNKLDETVENKYHDDLTAMIIKVD